MYVIRFTIHSIYYNYNHIGQCIQYNKQPLVYQQGYKLLEEARTIRLEAANDIIIHLQLIFAYELDEAVPPLVLHLPAVVILFKSFAIVHLALVLRLCFGGSASFEPFTQHKRNSRRHLAAFH